MPPMPTMRANTLMNLIDISSWQKGLNLSSLFAANPRLDGVIVKTTQGTMYINPEFPAWAKWLVNNGKPLGLYHYCDGADPEKEAEHFYASYKPYAGTAIPVADYEGDCLSKGTAWLKRFLDAFYALSGIRAMIYCSISVVQTQAFSALTDHPLWIAQYADMNPVNGFLDHPWQMGSVAPFSGYVMQQYTSCGKLASWDGSLDFDLFNGSYAEWVEMARGENTPVPTPTPIPAPAKLKDADPQIVLAVLKNSYGTGENRVRNLKAAGYNPDSVQDKINQLYRVCAKVKADIGNNMAYLNAILWIVRSM